MLKTLNRAIQRNLVLEMIYISKDGKVTKRRIKPFKVDNDSFIAYCFLRKSRRTFKVDNVLALVPVSDNRAVI